MTPADELTKQDYYLENVKRITEHRALAVRDRPDLAGWLYDLTGGTIPHRVYDDPTVRGGRTENASLADIDGMYITPKHGLNLPRCDVCGEEKLVRLRPENVNLPSTLPPTLPTSLVLTLQRVCSAFLTNGIVNMRIDTRFPRGS